MDSEHEETLVDAIDSIAGSFQRFVDLLERIEKRVIQEIDKQQSHQPQPRRDRPSQTFHR